MEREAALTPGDDLTLPAGTEYIVQAGDTWASAAQKHGTDAAALAAENDADPSSQLAPEVVIELPKIDAYVVQGQSLADAAAGYGNVTDGTLARANGLQADTVVAVDVQADASPEQSIAQARQAAAAFDSVLLLTDVLGATPSNVARALLSPDDRRRLVAGVNLPMLLRAVSYRNESLDDWMSYALLGGSKGVQQVV